MPEKEKEIVAVTDPFNSRKNPKGDLYFRISNAFQNAVRELTESEIRVYLYLSRFTNYKHGGWVEASISTIMKYTGLRNRNSISNATLKLVEKGWIGGIEHQDKNKNKYLINTLPEVNVELLKEERRRRKVRREAVKANPRGRDNKGMFSTKGSTINVLGGSRIESTEGSTINPTLLQTKVIKEEKENPTISSSYANASSSIVETGDTKEFKNLEIVPLPVVEDKSSPTEKKESSMIDASRIDLSASIEDRYNLVVAKIRDMLEKTKARAEKQKLENKLFSLEHRLKEYQKNRLLSPFINSELLLLELEYGLRDSV